MSLTDIFKPRSHVEVSGAKTPPIFADFVIAFPDGSLYRVDVEKRGWLKDVQYWMDKAARIGLVMRDEQKPRVWVDTNGDTPHYLSRVVGRICSEGHVRWRVAGVQAGGVSVWLHADGLVEIGPEPSSRGC